MKKIIIKPRKLNGNIDIQISKSYAHRALILSALSEDISLLTPFKNNVGNDIEITKKIIESLSLANTVLENDVLRVFPNKDYKKEVSIFSGESGTTLRLIIPILSALGIDATITGAGKLLKRPMEVYKKIYEENNLVFNQNDDFIKISGQLQGGLFKVDGDISSQFISGLLIASSLLKKDSTIKINGVLESRPYVNMTIETLKKFSVDAVFKNENEIFIKCCQRLKVQDPKRCVKIEADFSHAAFFIAAAAIGGSINIVNLNRNSIQGDKEIINIVEKMGAYVKWNADQSLTIKHNGRLNAIDIDIKNIPDLAPILVVLATYAVGTTRLTNAKRLKYKESDRIYDLQDTFSKIGAEIKASDDTIEIKGLGSLKGGETLSHNDHRLAMAVTVSSIISEGDIILNDYEATYKSSSNFYEQFISLGGSVIYL